MYTDVETECTGTVCTSPILGYGTVTNNKGKEEDWPIKAFWTNIVKSRQE
jgi:hypothetical protein